MNKNRIRLTESQLHSIIKESVKKVLKESALSSNASNVLISCNHNVSAVLERMKNDFANVYRLLRDGDEEDLHKAISAYRDIMNNFTYHEYQSQINNAYEPLANAFINSNSVNDDDSYEPEDWYERNEHGDFDTY